MQRTLIIILLFIVLVAIFALQNSAGVVIRLWFWSVETSLALVLILTFAAGAILGIVFSLGGKKRKKEPERHTLKDEPPADDVPMEVSLPAEENPGGDPEFEDVD
jgi:uncharacterized integral membrane protein